jgi:hypothetical protein
MDSVPQFRQHVGSIALARTFSLALDDRRDVGREVLNHCPATRGKYKRVRGLELGPTGVGCQVVHLSLVGYCACSNACRVNQVGIPINTVLTLDALQVIV